MDKSFFHPTEDFMDKLQEVIGDRFVIEIGSGEGLLLKALIDRKIPAVGIDPFSDFRALPLEQRGHIFKGDEDSSEMINPLLKIRKTVFLVARPCHNGFPDKYLRTYCYNNNVEMIYIGFVKNLELDFERDLSNIKLIEFPNHPDCDCVAVLSLTDSEFRDNDWRQIDAKVRELTHNVELELINWFLEKRKEEKNITPIVRTQSILSGGDWGEYEGHPLKIFDLKSQRKIELGQATYYVGGGHFANYIQTEDDSFVYTDEDGRTVEASPWDRWEQRPSWYEEKYWAGLRDNKRTSSVGAGLTWLKETYLEFEKHYAALGQTVYASIDSSLEYQLEEIMEYQKDEQE